jgi:acetyl-CoA carboxylase biotin carboxylase subunit
MFEGAVIPPYYDSMIAKLIVRGGDRADAVGRLAQALSEFRIEGIATNLPLLSAIAAHEDFKANRIGTRWLEQTLLPAFAKRKEH